GTDGVYGHRQHDERRLPYRSFEQNGEHDSAHQQSDARCVATPDFIARIAASSGRRGRATARNLYARLRVDVNTVPGPSTISKVLAALAAVVLTIGLGLVDYVTGREWAISALYLLPTCLTGWVAGRSAGFAVGALCTGVWFLSDILSGPMYQHPLIPVRSEEHTSELQSRSDLVCRLLLEKKNY